MAASNRAKIKEICEVLPNFSSKGKFRQERIVRLNKVSRMRRLSGYVSREKIEA